MVEAGEIQKRNEDISFKLPDLIASWKSDGGNYRLEAFKETGNDAVLGKSDLKLISQLRWVSIGNPKLVKTGSINEPSKL